MKTTLNDTTERQIDWLVAKCLGLTLHRDQLLDGAMHHGWWVSGYYTDPNRWFRLSQLRYSSDWALGGPIVDRLISAGFELKEATFSSRFQCIRVKNEVVTAAYGHTPLVAAMRCFIVQEMGNEVDIPEEVV